MKIKGVSHLKIICKWIKGSLSVVSVIDYIGGYCKISTVDELSVVREVMHRTHSHRPASGDVLTPWRRLITSMLVGASIFALSACGDNTPSSALTDSQWGARKLEALSGEFAAAGASSQKSAVDAWIVGYSAGQQNAAISYDPSGSGAGVNTFLTGAVSWAGTDAPLSDSQVKQSQAVCAQGTAFEVPTYVSPIAIAYNLSQYGLQDAHIQLSPATLAKIFNGSISRWNDPAIIAENPSIAAKLPNLAITPVWRSDKSGTTKTFQTYLREAAPQDWTNDPTETWPYTIGQGAKGTPSVVMTIGQAQGTIGYADFAQVSNLGTVSVQVGQEYVQPSAKATAQLINHSPLNVEALKNGRYIVDVDYATKKSGVYPIALVSYEVACTTYKSARTATFVRQWLTYVLSDEGQEVSEDYAGAAPLPSALREQMMKAVGDISSGDISADDSSSGATSSAKKTVSAVNTARANISSNATFSAAKNTAKTMTTLRTVVNKNNFAHPQEITSALSKEFA